jgi:hypothetical protein
MWQVTSGNDDLLPATCDLPQDEPIICVNPENLRSKTQKCNLKTQLVETQLLKWNIN